MNLLANRRLLPLQIALWVIPVAAVVWWATTQPAPVIPTGPGPIGELLGAVAVYALVTLVRAERWHLILVDEGIPAPRSETYALVPVGYMGNNVLPARAGEILRVFLLNKRVGAGRRNVLGTIFAERLLDAVALLVMMVVLAWNLIDQIRRPSYTAMVLVGVVLLVAVLAVVLVLLRYDHIKDRAVRGIKPMVRPTRRLLARHGLILMVISLVIWGLEASVYLLVAAAIDLPLDLIGAISVVAFANLCALVPAAPGYLGTYDAAVKFGVEAVTTVARTPTAYLLLLRFVLFVPITVVGAVILIVRYGGFAQIRAARAEAAVEDEPEDVPHPAERIERAPSPEPSRV